MVQVSITQLNASDELDESAMIATIEGRPAGHSTLSVRGARVHNLKNLNIEIPRDSFVVFTGLSGSGKSSLAFDTIFAEGQRRYVESLSAYARQFLGQVDRPDVDLPEVNEPQPTVDGRNDYRDLRLHATLVGADRYPALCGVR